MNNHYNTLNYYDYEIVEFSMNKAVVKLCAKVYGGGKSWWRLAMTNSYADEGGTVKIKESRVSLDIA